MLTHKFRLPSGVMCEVGQLLGKHQRLLTEKVAGKTHGDRLNAMLADVIVSVGSIQNPSADFVAEMLSIDKEAALVEVRQFTMDFEEKFKFRYNYEKDGEPLTHDLEIDLKDGVFNVEQMADAWAEGRPEPEYKDIVRERELVLPKTGKLCQFVLLDGRGEAYGMASKTKSSHTRLEMHKPKEFVQGTATWKKLDLDNLPLKDIEALRDAIKGVSGKVDTEIRFRHPDADNLPETERWVTVNLLGTVGFFFPSGVL